MHLQTIPGDTSRETNGLLFQMLTQSADA